MKSPLSSSQFAVTTTAAVVIVSAFFTAGGALACSCAPLPPDTNIASQMSSKLENGETIFIGKVVALKRVEHWYAADHRPSHSAGGYLLVHRDLELTSSTTQMTLFRVIRSWQGIDNHEVWLETGTCSSSCGVTFTFGEEYLVFAYPNPSEALRAELTTNLCRGSKKYSPDLEELSALGDAYVDWESLDISDIGGLLKESGSVRDEPGEAMRALP